MDEVASIRARHKSARPKPSNPAWCNSHYDLGRLLIAFDALELELAAEQEAPKWQAIAASYQSEHLALKARVAELEGTVRHRDRQITAIVDWLTTNQDDVFRRGLWDAIPKNLTAAETTGDDNAKGCEAITSRWELEHPPSLAANVDSKHE